MDKRQLAPAFALSRLVELIDSSPGFVDVAKQSAAYEDLKSRVVEVHDFVRHCHANILRMPMLREDIRVTRREVTLLAESIVAVAALAHYTDKPWLKKLSMPSKRLDHLRFAVEANALATAAEEHAHELIEMGMLPGRPKHLREVADRLEKLRAELAYIELTIGASKIGYPYLVDRARKTARALFLQVRPLIDDKMRGEWQKAIHLSRESRRALPRATPRLALPNPEAASDAGDPDMIPLNAASAPDAADVLPGTGTA